MKNVRLLAAGVTALILGSALLSRAAFAQSFRSGTTTTIASGEVVDGSAYMAGQTIDVAGEVKGDLYCAGQTINITGTIHGDVLCAGQTVHISGTVEGNIRTAGQDVVISAKVIKNVTTAGQSVSLTATSDIGGDVTGGAATATINGKIGRDVLLGASDLTVTGQIARNLKSNVEHLRFGNGASVGGSVEYTSKNELTKSNEVKIAGHVARTEPKPPKANRANTAGKIYGFIASVFGAFILVLLFPSVYQNAYEHAQAATAKTALYGLLSLIAVPALFVALLFTVIGIPLAFMLLLIWVVVLMLSGSFTAFYIGKKILSKQRNPLLVMLSGALLVNFLQIVPYLGPLIGFASVVLGSGMLLREAMRRTPKPKYQM